MIVKYLKVILAFAITTVIMCAVNFVGQIVLLFMDIVSRWESSSLLTIVLWLVTGVFASVFTESAAGLLMKKEEITYPLLHNPILVVSIVAIIFAVALMIQGEFIYDPSEFTLFFSNGIVFTSYFVGVAGFSAIARKL